jgi:hypothetical protein
MLNLNKKLVTKNELLKHVSPLDIFNFYSGQELKLKKVILSPLREEKNPSFALFASGGEIFFKDFVLGGGDCIKFVKLMFGLNFMDALSKVVIDFDLKDHFLYKEMYRTVNNNFKKVDQKKVISKQDETVLKIKRRSWRKHDIKFWSNFGITFNTLKQYRVLPVEYIFLNNNIIKADKHAYAFVEEKDDIKTYKIYQPFNSKIKWLTTHDNSIWQGWQQLPKSSYNLIVTKSLKDIMAITSVTGISSTGLQNEGVKPKDQIVKELKDRFENIFLLYDNDFDSKTNWGRQFGEKISKITGIPQIEIPSKYKCKDFSDLIRKEGIEKSKLILNNLTNYDN